MPVPQSEKIFFDSTLNFRIFGSLIREFYEHFPIQEKMY